MQVKFNPILVFVTVSLLVPGGWLFASGNFPGVYYENKIALLTVNRAWPPLSSATFSTSRKIWRQVRREGIKLPLTYNERIVKIAGIRSQVNHLCDLILKDS